MEKYNVVRQLFEEAYKLYLDKKACFDCEYEKARHYIEEHKKPYKELTQKATECSQARNYCNELWNICLSHPLHYHFKGYSNPETGKFGVK